MRRVTLVLVVSLLALLVGLLGHTGSVITADPGRGEYVVSRIIDGDTIEVTPVGGGGSLTLRYAGIDAPELSIHECYSQEAKAYNAQLIPEGSHIWVYLTGEISDKREIAMVYKNQSDPLDKSVNAILVQEGYATSLSSRFRPLELQARAAHKGLWGQCFVPGHKLVIMNIAYDSNPEIVQICNRSDTDVSLNGYVLLSEPGVSQNNPPYYFPQDALIAGHHCIEVYSGPGIPPDVKYRWTGRNIWNNNGDVAWLLTPPGPSGEREYEDMYEYNDGYHEYEIMPWW